MSYVLKSSVLSSFLCTPNLAHFPGVDGSEIATVRASWSDAYGEFGFTLAVPGKERLFWFDLADMPYTHTHTHTHTDTHI